MSYRIGVSTTDVQHFVGRAIEVAPARQWLGRGGFLSFLSAVVCFSASLVPVARAETTPLVEPALDRWVHELSEGEVPQRRAAAAALDDAAPEISTAIEPLIQALGDRDPQVFAHVCSALGKCGGSAQQATDRLIKILAERDRQRAFRAADVLRCIGDSAVPPLMQVLAAGDKRPCAEALDALAGMGPDAAPAMAAIGKLLGGEDRDLDGRAVTALAAIGPAANPLLADLLQSPQAPVRRSALGVLMRLEPPPVDFRDPVLRLVQDENPEVRELAIETLVLMAPDDPLSAQQVLSSLRGEEGRVRETAIAVIRYLSPERQAGLLPSLLECLNDVDQPGLSEMAAVGLARISRHTPAAVEPLVKRWQQDPQLDNAYADAVRSLGAAGLDSLLTVAEKSPASDQEATVALIAGMGHTVSRPLIERLQEPDTAKRRLILECLGHIQPANPATVAAARKLLLPTLPTEEQPVAVRNAAVISLGSMGHLAQSAVPALRALRERVEPAEQQLIDEQLARIEQR